MSEQYLLIGVHFLAPETRSYFLKLKELTCRTSSSFLAFVSILDQFLSAYGWIVGHWKES